MHRPITAETLGIDSHVKLREHLAGLRVGNAIRASLPRPLPVPRLIAPTLPRIPNLKGLVRR